MSKFILISISLFSLFTNGALAQSNDSYTAQTKLVVQSQDPHGEPFNVYTESSFMNLSLSTGDFFLKSNLSDIRTGDSYLDSAIRSKPTQTLIFKGKMNDSGYMFGQRINDEKEYNLEGNLILNKVTIPCVAQFDPVNFAEKSDTKNYRMDFKLAIDPAKITILGLENKLNKLVVFEIMDGKLNTQP